MIRLLKPIQPNSSILLFSFSVLAGLTYSSVAQVFRITNSLNQRSASGSVEQIEKKRKKSSIYTKTGDKGSSSVNIIYFNLKFLS